MSRRWSAAVQREWLRCAAASPVALNNAARVEEKRPTSSLPLVGAAAGGVSHYWSDSPSTGGVQERSAGEAQVRRRAGGDSRAEFVGGLGRT